MFYLTTHSTHFYLRFYGVGHMIKTIHIARDENPLLPHGLLFPISSKDFLNEPSRRQDSTYHDLAAARKDPPLAFFFFCFFLFAFFFCFF